MVFKCKMCGGDIEITKGTNVAKCKYCKCIMTIPNIEDEKIINLYNRANDYRMMNDFDRAYKIYENILEIDNTQLEAHWGLLLSKYGVEYVDDPINNEKKPTCHRTISKSILKDNEFKIIEKNSFGENKKLYIEEAKKIDDIQKKIIKISLNEKPYDIFICYKETDEKNERTKDSVIAEDIYEKLTEKGYKVFFSKITLEEKIGSEYEPYIYSALNSSKIMLVIGTEEKYFNSIWVKNEWSRFLEMSKKDKNKTLIPVYSKIEVYNMPEEFSMLQAQSMDKIGAMQDLIRGIEKILEKNLNTKVSNEEIEKLKKVLDETANLGNGKYEVKIMREKFSVGYYIFLIFMLFMELGLNGLSNMVSILSIINFNSELIPMYTRINLILRYIVYIFFIIDLFLLGKNRKSHILGKKMLFYYLVLKVAAFYIKISFGVYSTSYFWYKENLGILPLLGLLILECILYFYKPKFHIDSSLKEITTFEKKEKISQKNNKILENFKERESIKIKRIVMNILLIMNIILIIYSLYKVLPININMSENKEIDQILIKANALVYEDEKFNIPNNWIAANEYINVQEIKTNKEKEIEYIKVSNNKKKTGYIKGEFEDIIYGKNSPYYGKTDSNERDNSKFQIKILKDGLNMRDDIYYGKIIKKLKKDDIYTVLDIKIVDGIKKYKIETTFGKIGFVAKGYNENNNFIEYIEELIPKEN